MFAEAESGDIGAIVCAGNLMLLLGILLSIFIVHLAVASGVEAYWLTKVTPTCHSFSTPYISRCLQLQFYIQSQARTDLSASMARLNVRSTVELR